MNKSKILIGVDKSGSYRVYLTITTGIVEEARKLHGLSPLASAALGRALTAAGMMSIQLKGDGNRLTLIFQGDGPAKQILVTGYGDGRIKGYISNPVVDLPLRPDGKLDVGGAIGVGDLTVVKDLGLKEPYTGSIALVSGEIADDLTAYYYISEQQNTSLALGVKVGDMHIQEAGGMFIQMLPGAEDGAIDALESMLKDVKPMTTNIQTVIENGAGKSEEGLLEDLMNLIFADMPEEYKPSVLEYKEMELKCDCSRERMEQALMTIGKHDLAQIIEEDGQAELECHFCGSKYKFEKDQLEKMLEEM